MKKILFASAIMLLIVACQHQNSEFKVTDNSNSPVAADSIGLPSKSNNEGKKETNENQPVSFVPLEKKIVKNATITVVTDSVEKYRAYLKTLVSQVDGYFGNENYNQYSNEKSLQIIARIPVDKFDAFVERALQYNLIVEQKTITAQDVTGEYHDSKLMADTKKAVRLRYLEMLSKATKISDMLEVQNAINDVQADIDLYQGRALYLSQTAAYSTLDITIKTKSELKEDSAWYKVKSAILSGWDGFSSLVLLLLSLWPMWLIVAGVFIGYKRFKRKTAIKSN